MKRTSVVAVALAWMVLTWPVAGCAKHEPAAIATAEASDEPATGHDQEVHGHKKAGGHKHHERGQDSDTGAAPKGSIKVGDRVPDVALHRLDGTRVGLDELRKDKRQSKAGVMVLSFWCSTCHSCRHVERQLAKLHKEYEGRAAVVALDANAGETAEEVAAFVRKAGLDLPVVLDPAGTTADLFGVTRTTTTVVIDGDGVLRYCGQFRHKDGGCAEDALRAVLAGDEVAVPTTPHRG